VRHRLLTVVAGVWFVLMAQDRSPAQSPDVLRIQATTIDELRAWDAYVVQRERAGTLRVRKVDRDPLLPQRTIERLQQYHQGVPIWGAELVRDLERGVPMSMFGNLSPDLTLSVEPTLSRAQSQEALLRSGGTDATLLAQPQLVIVRLEDGEHRLAYTAIVSGADAVTRVFIDAQTGAELLRYSEIQPQQAVGTGRGVLGDRKKLSVWSQAGGFVAFDTHRPPVLETFDMGGNLVRAKLALFLDLISASDLARDSDNDWTDVAVVDAHVHVSWTYDYFFKRFGRNGLDGRNSPINILTNAVSQQGALSLNLEDFVDFGIGAFWCGGCLGGEGAMFFGNGIPPGYYFGVGSGPLTGMNVTYLAGSLDVAAHELAHGVTESSSQLIYTNESGALNEAFSDIMGTSVEFFYHPSGTGAGAVDYLMGEDSFKALSLGARDGIRSMENPALYGDPDHYSKRYTGPDDGGGVHTNSGIANHAFYLAIEGGTNRSSGLAVQGVGAANREQIEKAFYRAFVSLLPPNATFSTARAATITAARDLYGVGSAAERAVTQAWTAVGVF